MRRRTFDAVAIIAGLVLTVVLAIGGALLLWGHSVVNTDVHNQLAAQKIVFPTASSPEIKALPASDAAAMKQYAGQLMTTGAQAETYADHFIAVHLGRSVAARPTRSCRRHRSPTRRTRRWPQQVQTVFRGQTLRGMLLNAYGWWQMGQIMLISAIVAFCAAGLFLILSGLGFWHLRRAAPETEVFPKLATRVEANAV